MGEFHLVMSFLGAVAFIMEGSGMQNIFAQVFAVNSMLDGSAYNHGVKRNV